MVNRSYPAPPDEPNIRLSSFYGILTVLGFLPLWHRLARIVPGEKLASWSATLATEGWGQPDQLTQTVLLLIDGVCVLGFVGVAVWSLLHFRGNQRWPAFPVLWLSLTMLLFQNLNALYFFKAPQPNTIHMHNVFWVLLALMTGYALVARPKPVSIPRADHDPTGDRFPWAGWIATGLVGMALIVILAGWINGETTMASANTRWPDWSWRDGPFPGR
jgi:hypothetical protein